MVTRRGGSIRHPHLSQGGSSMNTCPTKSPLTELELPCEFEDMIGLAQPALKAAVSMLTQRPRERLLLTRRESQLLQRTLWNGLTEAVNQAMEPLSADRR